MMHSNHSVEKRREYRMPLAMPATFLKGDTKKPLKGHINNISSCGAFARVADPIPKDTFLELFFKVPATGERIESGGTVRWCKGTKPCRLGIEFRDKLSFNLPLYDVAKLCSQSTTSTPADYSDKEWGLLLKSVEELQYLTYWGDLLRTFSTPIQTLFSHLGGQIGLSSFRLEKSYRQMEGVLADPKLKRAIEESISALEPLSGKFNEIASVFGLLRKRRYMELIKAKCRINLNHLIEDKINFFQDIEMKLTDKQCNIKYLPGEDLPLVYGQYSDFAQVIDFLIIYSYHFILFGNCTEITVRSMVKKNTIQLNFFNDGTKIFEKAHIVIDHISGDFVDQLTAREVKNISGLYYSLMPLKKYNAYIAVHSESGNNVVSLRIPV